MTFTIPGPALLFAPVNRPDILPKAAAKADMVILDLEDGAGDIDREQAYATIADCGLDPQRTIVRVVGPTDPHFLDDVAFVKTTPYSTIMVPKIYNHIPQELAGLEVIAMIETPQAVVAVEKIAQHDDVVALFWGAEDLTFMLGGTHSRHHSDEKDTPTYRDTMLLSRALMHIHAAAAGKASIDAVFADFRNLEGLYREAADAARSGFAATACIHPTQVDTIRKAYAPEPQQLRWAQRVIAEATNHPGAFKLDGEMVDAPLIAQAHRIVSRA
ncbi:MAG: CoA ester lyase [Corynebacterium sp.]|uniref:HpcH/HpaI aldolase/citrate lyase family protein n=1 Tax=Corynebacterium sp. TaxID=1720 RepID=UPI0026DC6DB2|nr:CoA ester lyase [Corynebacterium sp.]MDO4761839.1 CoA ester lyase [Corynebacterium sp.]